MLNGKVVLITGGTGSFGNKFVETILRDYPNVKKISHLLYKFPTCLKIRGVLKREAILPQQFHNNFNFCES